jgi:hypothetical protein
LLILTGFSWCSFIAPQLLTLDILLTTEFFDTQISIYRSSWRDLYILRGILESLTTFHLPAEVALKEIQSETKDEIKLIYNALIHRIDGHMSAQNNQAVIPDQPYSATYLCRTIMSWADHNHYLVNQHPRLKYYVFQKLFVVMLRVSQIAPISEFTPRLISSAAESISTLGFGRLCVAEGIMLAVFLKRPFDNFKPDLEMVKTPTQPKLETMWDGVFTKKALQNAITAYTINLVNTVLPHGPVIPYNPPESLPRHAYRTFIEGIIQFVGWAAYHNMKSDWCERILLWATHVWDLVLKANESPENDHSPEKDEIKNEFQITMDQLIASIRSREAGPSSRTH